jgi:Fanconi anemia group M protein
VILFDHAERRSGIPARLAALGCDVHPRALGAADYVLSERMAVLRRGDTDLLPWRALRRICDPLARLAGEVEIVVLLVVGRDDAVAPELRRGALAKAVAYGASVLEAADAEEAACLIARLAQEDRWGPDLQRGSLGRKTLEPDRLAEQVAAWLPGVSFVGARRLLEHFGSLRALLAADEDGLMEVEGFGPKRAAAIVDLAAHPYRPREERLTGAAP